MVKIDEFVNIELARINFYEFCLFMDEKFFTKKKKHLKKIAELFQRAYMKYANGEKYTIGISTPPRAGKSYITSLFCAWMLGKFPEESIMRNSYSATLAEKLSYDTRDLIKTEKFIKVFPTVALSIDKHAVSGWNLTTAKQVSYFCAGVGGSITGFGASLMAILDDPIKNFEDSQSETIIDKLGSWFESAHKSRLEGNCIEIHISTRWSKKDPIGIISKRNGFDEQIIISALDENDESFCEEVHTTEYYLDLRKITSKAIFLSIYQQQPTEISGMAFYPKDFKFFKFDDTFKLDLENYYLAKTDDKIFSTIEGTFGYIDTKLLGTDYFAKVFIAKSGAKFYVIDAIFTDESYEYAMPACIEMIKKYRIENERIETNSSGIVFKNDIQKECTFSSVSSVKNTANKRSRILFQTQFIKEYFVFRDDVSEGSDYAKFMQNVYSYPINGDVTHDDAPDVLAGSAQWLRNLV